jgi:hypothetical protein
MEAVTAGVGTGVATGAGGDCWLVQPPAKINRTSMKQANMSEVFILHINRTLG